MTTIGSDASDSNPDAPDQDASVNKVDAGELDDSPTADKDPAEGADEAAED